jgi:hypothetical protein
VSDKNVSDMTDDEIRAMAGVSTSPANPGLSDWPATREAIDVAIQRAREDTESAVRDALGDLGETGRKIAGVILGQVQDSLDDIDHTIPPESDDD